MSDNNRRNFLKVGSLGLLTTGIVSTLPACAYGSAVSKSIETNHKIKDWVIFDGLGGIYDINASAKPSKIPPDPYLVNERLKNDLLASGLTVVRQTAGVVRDVDDLEGIFENTLNNIRWYHRWVIRNPEILTLAYSIEDILAAKKDNKIAVTLGFQNSHLLGDDVDRVDVYRNLGVLTMQLTYNGQNQLGGGSNVNEDIPLSKFGHAAVEKMNASNVLIDLSHSGQQTCLDALNSTTKPVTISHSGCRAITDYPRNKTDKEMRLLVEKGGVFGIYFMPFLTSDGKASSEHLIAHLEHALDVCGEDHVAIGTDGGYSAIDDLELVREMFRKFTQRRIDSGSAAAGEYLDNLNFLPDIVGPNQFMLLADKLSLRGHSDRVIEKILGLNALRVAKEVWGS